MLEPPGVLLDLGREQPSGRPKLLRLPLEFAEDGDGGQSRGTPI
jgi:hypothetical protein